MKVTLTRIFTKNAVSPRTGKAYVSMSIKTQEHGDMWLSGFQGADNVNWAEGDTVDIVVTEKAGNDGKTYLNFKSEASASRSASKSVDLTEVNSKLDKIISLLQKSKEETGEDVPDSQYMDSDGF